MLAFAEEIGLSDSTVYAAEDQLSIILEGGNLTIGVRSGTALNIGFTGTTFNVVNRAGGNVPITI